MCLTNQNSSPSTHHLNHKGNIMKFSSLAIALSLAFCAAPTARSGPAPFTTVDFPNAVFTDCVGINRFGDIVGHYVDASGIDHGYLLHKGGFSTVDFPGGEGGHVHDINSSGAIVGMYLTGKRYHGFVLNGSAYTTIDFP